MQRQTRSDDNCSLLGYQQNIFNALSQDYHSFFHQDLSHLLERVNFGEAERWPALEGQGGDLPPYFDLGFHNILLVISTTFFEFLYPLLPSCLHVELTFHTDLHNLSLNLLYSNIYRNKINKTRDLRR